jgi:hypothetical protein
MGGSHDESLNGGAEEIRATVFGSMRDFPIGRALSKGQRRHHVVVRI